MEKLPPELLSKILLYLPPMDRLSCSLTCRCWAEAMSSSRHLHGIWLDIAGHEMEAARSVLVNSQRQYTKLLLHRADLSEFDSAFWESIGANLRVLVLKECSWSTHVFYAILQQCTKLESLKIADDFPRKIGDFVRPESACFDKLRSSLSHLRHLHLDIELTAEVLDLLLRMMSNVTSIILSPRLDKESNFLERLPSILKKNRIVRLGANFYNMANASEQIIKFVGTTSGSLEELRFDYTQLSESACDAIVSCTRLRRLTIKEFHPSFNASHLKTLVSNSPGLEVLKICNCADFEDRVTAQLFGFKKLRSLTLRRLDNPGRSEEFLCSLGEITTLAKLDLRCVEVGSRLMRSLGRLKNLRSLVIQECVDSACFEAICENFGRLTELDLGYVSNLTDSDGSKLCRFKELRSLSFSGGFGFADLTFERGVGPRAMKSVVIGHCPMTDAGLVSIASHHDRLEELYLASCDSITDDGIVALLRNEPRLKSLCLRACSSLRYEWYTALRNFCPRLREWRIHNGARMLYCSDLKRPQGLT